MPRVLEQADERMTEPINSRHVPNAALEPIDDKVTDEGGELRILQYSDYGQSRLNCSRLWSRS